MVSEDEIFDHLGESVLIGEFNALGDVRNDDLGRLFFGQFVVGIVAGLIFGEKAGIGEFADVVIEGAGADKLHLCADSRRHLRGKVTHLNGVDERALGFFGQTPDDGRIGVVEFDERHTRSEAKGLLDEIQQGVGEEERHARDDDVAEPRTIGANEATALREFEHHPEDDGTERHNERGEENLRAFGKILDAIDTHQTRDELREDELVMRVERYGGQEHHREMRHESRAGVGEDAQHDGEHGEGDDVDREKLIGAKEISEEGEDGDDGENEIDRVGRLIKVAPEHAEIDDQQCHEGGNESKAAEKDDALVVYVLFSALTFATQGVENGFLAKIHALTAVDDALAAEHETGAARDARKQLGFSLLGLDTIVDEVGFQVFMEIESREEVARVVLVVHDVLISGAGRENRAQIARYCVRAVHHTHAASARSREPIHRFATDHAGGIDTLKRAHGIGDVGVGDSCEMSRGAVGGEVAYLLLRHSFVAIIVGIEGAEGAVAFGSELFGRFIDRKFEVGDERRIVPGLPHLIVVAGFRVSGQGEEQAEGTCHANEQEIEPVIDMEFELHGRCSEKSV